jgi:hypothetical protein
VYRLLVLQPGYATRLALIVDAHNGDGRAYIGESDSALLESEAALL